MALIHRATLTPSKLELLQSFVPGQPWFRNSGETASLQVVGAYRFDDPDGAVGLETHLLRDEAGAVLQVPLTYRDAPLAGADASLAGTLQHSVLGQRWVYDGCADPVFVRALVAAILTGGSEASLEFGDGERRASSVHVIGTGRSTAAPTIDSVRHTVEGTTSVITTDGLRVVVRHLLDDAAPDDTSGQATELSTPPALVGTWPDGTAVLATVH